ncbi:MAG: replication initiation factor domain-containing protein [Oscillospiraceae bacterium]|nr:replication initiation factor domain-containing protein [Oscillospiraceae bacterium]
MITCKPSDYLTISLIPDKDNNIDLADFITLLLDTMHLSDMLPLMRFMCSTSKYEQILRYEDIQIKIPYAENYKKQGICLEFSGNGVNYYIEWLKSKYNTSLRSACRRFYALVTKGFKPNCSRFDVAFDEKILNSGEEKYLDLDVIESTLRSRCFVSCFRKGDPDHSSGEFSSVLIDLSKADEKLHCDFISSMNLSNGVVGKTIQLGKRNSSSVVRFYDKRAEQEVKGVELPNNLSSWVRCECEFKKLNANSVMMKFVELSEKDFVTYCSGVLLNLIRFINLDRSRRSNCTVCDWWLGFLKHAKRAKLVHFKPQRNKYIRAVAYQKKSVSACLTAISMCDPREIRSIYESGLDMVADSKSAQAIIADYNALKNLSPYEFDKECHRSLDPLTGVQFLRLFTAKSDDEFNQFLSELKKEIA